MNTLYTVELPGTAMDFRAVNDLDACVQAREIVAQRVLPSLRTGLKLFRYSYLGHLIEVPLFRFIR
jgi:hypothetical protein